MFCFFFNCNKFAFLALLAYSSIVVCRQVYVMHFIVCHYLWTPKEMRSNLTERSSSKEGRHAIHPIHWQKFQLITPGLIVNKLYKRSGSLQEVWFIFCGKSGEYNFIKCLTIIQQWRPVTLWWNDIHIIAGQHVYTWRGFRLRIHFRSNTVII